MLYMMWLRSYPSYHNHVLIFNVSVATVHNEILLMQSDLKENIRTFCAMAYNNRIEKKNQLHGLSLEHLQKYISSANRTTRIIFFWASTFPCNTYASIVIDNAGYICYAESRFLGHQNDAKQFTIMQQIGVNGPLHFSKDSIFLADKIYPNRHPTVTLFTTQQINRKPEHMRDRSIFIRLLGQCIGILGTYFFSCIRPQGKQIF